ncbi:MAG: hypothetical protein COY81_01560 [Candidatus Pacebacteria bacterium CG_4_10_14_0_8_um_filter_43_12]|nr:MAG: hypothetical protein COY81_01560 [Candidatus Pacebacteria bacterium CG_4_10_14_0_8_um_filter_43_12]
MKKIFYGVMSLVMTGAIVTASAYALFSAQATVSGIGFTTSTAGILVSPDGHEENYHQDFNANLSITGAYPGFGVANNQKASLWIQNTSTGIAMDLTAQLTAATGWGDNDLKNYVQVAVILPIQGVPLNGDYQTLATWNTSDPALTLPGGSLASGDEREFWVFVRLPEEAPDTLENTSLTDITFTITGTQAD